MSFPRYPKYKPSGVEWLGDVPEHWEVVQFKQFVDIQNGADHKLVEKAEGYPVIGSGGIFAYASNFLYDGESVLLGRKGTIDKPLHVTGRFWTVDTMYWTKINGGACGRLVYYLALTIPFDYYSTNTALPSMTKGSLNSHLVSRPPLSEQTAIAEFLDRETAKIDGLMGEQRRLIELLKEKRQAVISHAVTRGLNPHAPRKPSGIEWLGDVPEHWEVCLLKRAFRSVDYGISDSLDSEGAVAILRMGNIENGKIVTDDLKYTDSVDPQLLLEFGDLLYNRTNSLDLIGKVGMFVGTGESPVSFASYLVRLRMVSDSLPDYFAYFLNTEGILGLARSNAFVAIGQCNLNPTRYGQIVIAIPPRDEQASVVSYLDTETARLDTLTAEAERAIALLQERRSALISAAVTGQIDVRQKAEGRR